MFSATECPGSFELLWKGAAIKGPCSKPSLMFELIMLAEFRLNHSVG